MIRIHLTLAQLDAVLTAVQNTADAVGEPDDGIPGGETWPRERVDALLDARGRLDEARSRAR